jgi:lipopolysaccharide transport system ATP-binding protein
MDRLLQFVDAGGTLLFCSHAMYYVSAFCQRALWLRQGRAEALGPVAEVVRDYENFLLAKSVPAGAGGQDRAALADRPAGEGGTGAAAGDAGEGGLAAGGARDGGGGAAGDQPLGPARLLGVRVSGGASAEAPAGAVPLFAPGDDLELEIEWESQRADLAFHVGIGINRIDDLEVCSLATHLDGRPPMTGRTHYRISAVLPRLILVKGEFTLYVFLLDEAGLHIYDQRIYRRAFGVHSPGYAFGVVSHDHRWQVAAPMVASRDTPGLSEPAERRPAASSEAAATAARAPAAAPATAVTAPAIAGRR